MKRHRCKPAEKIVAFHHACGVCGKEIEVVFCRNCHGTGIEAGTRELMDCRRCKGSGVARWKPAKEEVR